MTTDLPALAARIRELDKEIKRQYPHGRWAGPKMDFERLMKDHATTIADALERCGKMEAGDEYRPPYWTNRYADTVTAAMRFYAGVPLTDDQEVALQSASILHREVNGKLYWTVSGTLLIEALIANKAFAALKDAQP